VRATRGLLTPVVAVSPTYLQAAIDEMRARCGTFEGYFRGALELGDDAQVALRAAFLESA
jgi:hypothetical protein